MQPLVCLNSGTPWMEVHIENGIVDELVFGHERRLMLLDADQCRVVSQFESVSS